MTTPTFSFSAFGPAKQKRTVADVFSSFTKELQDIHKAELDNSAKLAAEIKEKQDALDASRKEQTKAAAAIQNIKQLLGV